MLNLNNVCHNKVWEKLMEQQLPLVRRYACKEFLDGLEKLCLPVHTVPQISVVSRTINRLSGWSLQPVKSLLNYKDFFYFLANKQFPVVEKLRPLEEIDFYTQESPDFFHEIFGHCPLLTNSRYAESMQLFAIIALEYNDHSKRSIFEKIFWSTYEFGVINNTISTLIFGAGILPSKREIFRVIKNKNLLTPLNIYNCCSATLKGNIAQPEYYTVDSLEKLFLLVENDLKFLLHKK